MLPGGGRPVAAGRAAKLRRRNVRGRPFGGMLRGLLRGEAAPGRVHRLRERARLLRAVLPGGGRPVAAGRAAIGLAVATTFGVALAAAVDVAVAAAVGRAYAAAFGVAVAAAAAAAVGLAVAAVGLAVTAAAVAVAVAVTAVAIRAPLGDMLG